MASNTAPHNAIWTVIAPLLLMGMLLISASWAIFPALYSASLLIGLLVTVIAAVHHAEVIAYAIGEPFGTLVLALAVTIIESSLIVSIMLSLGDDSTTLARDTVFATVMIILNLIIGLCFLIGGIRFGEQSFRLQGVSASLTTLTAIVILTLVLPNFTTTVAGPVYTPSQLSFVAIVSLVLYSIFIFVQAVQHRDYFLTQPSKAKEPSQHPKLPLKTVLSSFIFLLISLVGVVVSAKYLSPTVEHFVRQMGAPKSLVGILIALVVLLPEGLASLRAAYNNRLQTSLNLALGSALATIGLTIPTVAMVAFFSHLTLTLGLDSKSVVLLVLSLFVASLSMSTGRVTLLQGAVHLVIFLTYLFMTIVP